MLLLLQRLVLNRDLVQKGLDYSTRGPAFPNKSHQGLPSHHG